MPPAPEKKSRYFVSVVLREVEYAALTALLERTGDSKSVIMRRALRSAYPEFFQPSPTSAVAQAAALDEPIDPELQAAIDALSDDSQP